MSQEQGGDGGKTVSNRAMEIVVALFLMAVATLVMADSWRIGAGWSPSGPESGYFPFYVGALMFVSSAVTLIANIVTKTPDLSNFVERSQFRLVLQVLIPAAAFVIAIGFLGLYVASALFIGFFMWWLGKYPIVKILPVAIPVPILLFLMFEEWFLVPLPKGPLERLLGY